MVCMWRSGAIVGSWFSFHCGVQAGMELRSSGKQAYLLKRLISLSLGFPEERRKEGNELRERWEMDVSEQLSASVYWASP